MRNHPILPLATLAIFCLASLSPASTFAQQPQIDSLNKARVQEMLRDAHDEVKKNYYDTSYHGHDWDTEKILPSHAPLRSLA